MTTTPISVRLDQDLRDTLEAEARAQGIGLATLLRDLARHAARGVRRARIRAQSEAVGQRIAGDPEAQSFMRTCCNLDWPR